MQFELASRTDEPDLRRLLREVALPGAIQLSLEREPCIRFGNAIEGESHDTIVARAARSTPVIAMGTRTVAKRYVNGVPVEVAYLGQLRVAASHRGNPALLRRGYALLRELQRQAAAPWCFTTIISDNVTARRVLEAGLPGMPRYTPLDELVTLLLPTLKRLRGPGAHDSAEPARPADLDAIAECLERNGRRYQFARAWTAADLLSEETTRGLKVEDFVVARRGRHIAGCLACWDQRGFKQAVVRGYAPWLRRMRIVNNLIARYAGSPRLPRIGSVVPFAFLSHLAVDADDPDVFMALLAAAMQAARRRGLDYVSLDMSAGNPMLSALPKNTRPLRYESRVYNVSWADTDQTDALPDGRPSHPEAAVL